MQDLADVKPIRAVSALKRFKASDLWPLAKDKVRHAHEPPALPELLSATAPTPSSR
jgi:hypothetical protein